jgi:hypothetical protein
MRRNAPWLIALFSATIGTLPAQQPVREQPPLYRGAFTQVDGVFVTPIAGAPLSATVLIQSKQALPDGSVESKSTQAQIARDSRGRIHNEQHVLEPDSFRGTPPLISAHIFDPETRISYFLNPATMIARQRWVPPPPQSAGLGNDKGEDLGYSTLNGLQARGTKFTRTVPAEVSGTGKPVVVTDETWYSEDLHMNLLERHTDVRGGEQTVAILSIRREEPARTLFEVPAGYKVVDLTPPANAPVANR